MIKYKSVISLPALAGMMVFLAAICGYSADDRAARRAGLSQNEIRRLPVEKVQNIEFNAPDNISGEVRIRTDIDAVEAQIKIDENVYNIEPGDRSKRILASITVETEVIQDILRVEVKAPRGAEWEGSQIGVKVDLELLLPAGWVFHGESSSYSFDISGPFREVTINGTYGKVRVKEVTELANLRTEYGTLTLIGARGQVEVTNRYGAMTLEDITVSDIPLRIRSEHGMAKLHRISGPVDIAIDDAEVGITDWTLETGSSRIATQNSPITVHFAKWGTPILDIENNNAEVDISTPEEFSATIRLKMDEAGGGYIRTRGIPVKATHLDRRTLEGLIGNGGGLLKVFVSDRGDITLHGPMSAANRRGKG